MTKRALIWLVILIAAPSSVCAQQEIQSLEPGQRVRINGRIEASYVAVSGDSLVVISSSFPLTSFPLASLTRLEVGRARTVREGAFRGLGWGAAIGTGTGLVFGLADASGESCAFCYKPGTWEVVLASAVLAAVGAMLGLIIGSNRPGMTWSEVQLSLLRTPTQESPRVQVQATVGKGIGFSASIRTSRR